MPLLSNLSVLSKLLERLVVRQLMEYPSSADLDSDRAIQLKLPSCECCQIFYRLSIVMIWLLWSFWTCRQPSIPSTIPCCYGAYG